MMATLALPRLSNAATYYISTNGNDANAVANQRRSAPYNFRSVGFLPVTRYETVAEYIQKCWKVITGQISLRAPLGQILLQLQHYLEKK